LKANNEVAPFTVRVNDLKISKKELVDILTKDGFEVENGKYLDEALIIRNPSAVQKMDAFAKGYFQVQDESSMLVAKVLDPKPGETILDVLQCARRKVHPYSTDYEKPWYCDIQRHS